MNHVEEIWTERVVGRIDSAKSISMTHVLVVVTDLLTDLDILDLDALDYLEGELRRQHGEINEIRFIPSGRSGATLDAEGAPVRSLPAEAVQS